MFKFISVVVLSLVVSSCDEATEVVKFDNDRDTLNYQLIQSIKARDCFKIFASMPITKAEFFAYDSTLKGYFLDEGICTDANPVEALNTYLKSDTSLSDAPFINARIGNIYYEGKGVSKDLDKANYYFKKAIVDVGPLILFFADEKQMAEIGYKLNTNSPAYHSWGLTTFQLETMFTIEEVGPWDLPQPLLDQVEWVYALNDDDYLALAHHLHDGTGGYEKNLGQAIYWLSGVTGPDYPQENTELYLGWINERRIESNKEYLQMIEEVCEAAQSFDIEHDGSAFETEEECMKDFANE